MSIGRCCGTTDFLRAGYFTRFNSPFEWMFIDFQTVIENIEKRFQGYMDNIIVYNVDLKSKIMVRSTTIDPRLNDLDKFTINNRGECYSGVKLRINQSYLPDKITTGDIGKWERICIFHHLDITNLLEMERIQKRINIFNLLMDKYKENTLLVYITDNYLLFREEYFRKLYKLDVPLFILCNNCTLESISSLDNITIYCRSSKTSDNNVYDYIKRSYDINLKEKPNL